jgi:DNA topoisomerase-2
MDYTQEGAMSTLRYGKLVVLSDQDVDGMHIRGLVLNFFRIKFPSLLELGYV